MLDTLTWRSYYLPVISIRESAGCHIEELIDCRRDGVWCGVKVIEFPRELVFAFQLTVVIVRALPGKKEKREARIKITIQWEICSCQIETGRKPFLMSVKSTIDGHATENLIRVPCAYSTISHRSVLIKLMPYWYTVREMEFILWYSSLVGYCCFYYRFLYEMHMPPPPHTVHSVRNGSLLIDWNLVFIINGFGMHWLVF